MFQVGGCQSAKRNEADWLASAPFGVCRAERRAAFTLIETLVVVAIITILLALLLPVLRAARDEMKTLKCSSNLRTVAFKFQLFAQGQNPEGRGESERLGQRVFFINDFQDYLYRIDEFWDQPGRATGTLDASETQIMCPAGAPQLIKRVGFPCSIAAIGPAEDVSLAVNMRLHRAVVEFSKKEVLAPAAATRVRSDVLNHPYVPLLMDVDGREALARHLQPFYTAPPLEGESGPYAGGRYWIPSKRHGGRTNVAFVGGHVSSSAEPQREPWDWEYQAQAGK